MGETLHIPVLVEEVLQFLEPRPGGRYLDLTLGGGGHARRILEFAPECRVVGVDRDRETLARTAEKLAEFGERFVALHAWFDRAGDMAEAAGIGSFVERFDGVLLDLGISSLQLDDGDRGMSFDRDGRLDMRMDRSVGETAAELLDRVSEQELADLLFRFGDEARSRAIARALVERRRHAPVRRSGELADLVERAVGGRRGRKTHPATATFQALRIAVNDELGCLQRVLPATGRWLVEGGRLVVLSFHSGEDRIVKRYLRSAEERGEFSVLTPKGVEPGRAEVVGNPRSRSARLRAARRTGGGGGAGR